MDPLTAEAGGDAFPHEVCKGLRTNTHLYFPRAVVPVASARLASGTHRIEARFEIGPLARFERGAHA